MTRNFTPLVEAGSWLLLILLAFIYTFQFDDPLPVYDWGPAHWPRMVLFGMFAAASWLLYLGWRQSNRVSARDVKSSVQDDVDQLTGSARVRVILLFATPIIYTILIHQMGFLLITPFFLFGYMILMGVRRLRTLILVTVGIYTMLVIVFVKLIFTYLPPGHGVFNQLNGHFLGLLS